MVLFSSSRNGNSDIYLMTNQGKNVEQLTFEKTEQWGPVWIDANTISYLSQDNDLIEIIHYNLKSKGKEIIEQPQGCIIDDKNILYSRNSDFQVYLCKGDIILRSRKNNQLKNLTKKLEGTANYPSLIRGKNEICFTRI